MAEMLQTGVNHGRSGSRKSSRFVAGSRAGGQAKFTLIGFAFSDGRFRTHVAIRVTVPLTGEI